MLVSSSVALCLIFFQMEYLLLNLGLAIWLDQLATEILESCLHTLPFSVGL